MSEDNIQSPETPIEAKTITFPEFCEKSFECIFNQNVHLHTSLAEVLKLQFKTQEDKTAELISRIDTFEENIKQAFLFYTREIMKGLDDANQVIIDRLPQGMEMDPTSIVGISGLENFQGVVALPLDLQQQQSQG
jgi:hypothetical protein